ncbi:MAG: hypothetical protein MK008_10310 [Bdellovibrionales bacterium]|nr:hypothetical protein [Bdellovibrionales bacterium]
MCSIYEVNISSKGIKNDFNNVITPEKDWNLTVHGYMKREKAPIVLAKDTDFEVKEAIFSLRPDLPKYATYNARMTRPYKSKDGEIIRNKVLGSPLYEPIFKMRLWKEPFLKHQFCFVPVSAAHESCYFNSHAGQIVKFFQSNDAPYYCLGMYDVVDGEYTFTLLTDGPYKTWYKVGHSRGLIVVNINKNKDFLFNNEEPMATFTKIRKIRTDIAWDYQVVRDLKTYKGNVYSVEEMDIIRTSIF